jgi:hypothetical protein
MQKIPAANLTFCVHLAHYMAAGTASATTLNGASGARLLGGALASSITVTEVKA